MVNTLKLYKMGFKGTKGEWKVVKSNRHEEKVCTSTHRIADVKHYEAQVSDVLLEPTKNKGIANAHLIAASPELLELALLVYGSFGGGLVMTFSEKDVEKFEQAINKALNK